jgi:ABC-2 type transport system ATP-binding protein
VPASLPAVEVDGLTKTYDGRTVVDGLSFTVQRGEVFALLGPNGAGKTTTVETLEGYRRPDSGSVRVLGLDPVRDRRALRERIGVMLQEGGVHPGIRTGEALRLFAAFYPTPVAPDSLLDALGLRDVASLTVRRLSGGQRRRLSLALALVGRPAVAFLDEPTAGMDVRARATTWRLVEDMRDAGTTVVLTTHALDEAEALAETVAIIDRGRLVAMGSPSELSSGGAEDTRFSARPGLDTDTLAAGLGLAAGAVEEVRPGAYRVAAAPTPDLVASLAGWLRDEGEQLGDLQAGRRSLEEVFLRLTAQDGEGGGSEDGDGGEDG